MLRSQLQLEEVKHDRGMEGGCGGGNEIKWTQHVNYRYMVQDSDREGM
jgi:hypothetical protein